MCVRVCACVCVCVQSACLNSNLYSNGAQQPLTPADGCRSGQPTPLTVFGFWNRTAHGKKTKRVCVCVICVFRSRWALVPCLAGVMADLCVCACMCAVVGLHVISQDCAVHAASIHVQYTVRFYSGPPTFCVAGHVLHFSYVCHWSSILKFSYSATSREMPVV